MPISQTTSVTCDQCKESLPIIEDGVALPFIALTQNFPSMGSPVILSNLTCLTNWTTAQLSDNAEQS